MNKNKLVELFYSKKNNCCKCGCSLVDNTGFGLGSCFVLDTEGNFYCMNCDGEFENGDERIFEADLCNSFNNNEDFVSDTDEDLVFDTDEEAKEWGRKQNASKYAYINCKIGDEDVILCQTDLVYEDEVWNGARDIMAFLGSLLPNSKRPNEDEADAYIDDASEIRDMILDYYEKTYKVRIIRVFDEY